MLDICIRFISTSRGRQRPQFSERHVRPYEGSEVSSLEMLQVLI